MSARPKALTVALIALALLPIITGDQVVLRDRSFYGSYAVKDVDGWRVFSHGTTIHGQQSLTRGQEPSTYYARSGPVGDAFEAADAPTAVGAVGLGVGTIAAYGQPGQSLTFFEIDPSVIEVATDPELFTYLSDSAADVQYVVGDGRLELEEQPRGSYDLLLLDAFTSDAIPVHLLTQEAFATYADTLSEDGLLMVHISNRVFDLEPVVAAGADELGWQLAVGSGEADDETGATPSKWVAMSSDRDKITELLAQDGWREPGERRVEWTDDFSSVLTVLDLK
nr:fused MFS/spermidine synthase [Tessaracoccus sp. MC1756]